MKVEIGVRCQATLEQIFWFILFLIVLGLFFYGEARTVSSLHQTPRPSPTPYGAAQ